MLDTDLTLAPTAAPMPAGDTPRPTRDEAEAAVRTLIRWAGDEPAREGLLATPARVVRAYEEWFAGYRQDPAGLLSRTFEEVGGYDEMVVLRDIPLQSTCEHHMAAIRGVVHVAYLPNQRVVGISKLARLVDTYAKRLQTQEHMTSQVAIAIEEVLKARGVAVMMEAEHMCMSIRGVNKPGALTVTTHFAGDFKDATEQVRFMSLLRGR